MFRAASAPTLAALSYTFDNAEDDLTLQKAVVGFQYYGLLAAHYGLYDILDNIVISLFKSSNLNREGNWEALQSRSDDWKKIDSWAMEFGRNPRGQIAALLMFRLVHDCANALRKGWHGVSLPRV